MKSTKIKWSELASFPNTLGQITAGTLTGRIIRIAETDQKVTLNKDGLTFPPVRSK